MSERIYYRVPTYPGKSWNVFVKFPGSEKSWKLIEFAGMRMQKYVRTLLAFVIRSYGDKIFSFITCDSDEHCSMDATVTLLYLE